MAGRGTLPNDDAFLLKEIGLLINPTLELSIGSALITPVSSVHQGDMFYIMIAAQDERC